MSDSKLFILGLIFALLTAAKIMFPDARLEARESISYLIEKNQNYTETIAALGKNFGSPGLKDEIKAVLGLREKKEEIQDIEVIDLNSED